MLKSAMAMKILIDTSAFIAILSLNDINNRIATTTWKRLIQAGDQIYVNNYLIVETIALLQNRMGMKAVHEFQSKIYPLLNVDWINADQHQKIINSFLLVNRRHLSLVDCASFETMHHNGIESAFTFDPHFTEQGFNILPRDKKQGNASSQF